MVEVQLIGKVKAPPDLRGPGALRPLDHVNCIAHRNTSRHVSLILQVRSSIKYIHAGQFVRYAIRPKLVYDLKPKSLCSSTHCCVRIHLINFQI